MKIKSLQLGNIIVNDKNDQRLKSYNDSIALYNFTQNEYKRSLYPGETVRDELNRLRAAGIKPFTDKVSIDEYMRSVAGNNKYDIFNQGVKPVGIWSYKGNFSQIPIYKKPVQKVIYQPKEEPKQEIPTKPERSGFTYVSGTPYKMTQSQWEELRKTNPNIKPLESTLTFNDSPIDTTNVKEYVVSKKLGGNLPKATKGIYIKPENRGKFTATKKRTGKTTEELTHSKNPVTRKRAVFSQNSASWHKKESGGEILKAQFGRKLRIQFDNLNQQNSHLNFVQRGLNPDKYPVINNPDGSHSTHRMGYSGSDNGYIVYPTIIQDSDSTLKQLSSQDAVKHALQTGEFIEFDKRRLARKYSKNGLIDHRVVNKNQDGGRLIPKFKAAMIIATLPQTKLILDWSNYNKKSKQPISEIVKNFEPNDDFKAGATQEKAHKTVNPATGFDLGSYIHYGAKYLTNSDRGEDKGTPDDENYAKKAYGMEYDKTVVPDSKYRPQTFDNSKIKTYTGLSPTMQQAVKESFNLDNVDKLIQGYRDYLSGNLDDSIPSDWLFIDNLKEEASKYGESVADYAQFQLQRLKSNKSELEKMYASPGKMFTFHEDMDVNYPQVNSGNRTQSTRFSPLGKFGVTSLGNDSISIIDVYDFPYLAQRALNVNPYVIYDRIGLK